MTDIAELGLRVNAQPVEAATKTLTNFKQVSESTEKSVTRNTNGMNAGFKNVSVGVNSVKTSATNAAPALKILEAQTERAAKAGGGFAYKAKQMSMQLSQVASQGAVTGNYLQALTKTLTNFKQVSESTEKSVVRGMSNVSSGVKSVGTASTQSAPAMAGFANQTMKAANAGGGFAYKAKQMSMQLSQVASQGAVTGNYLQALAIQLPDLALGFGAVGVLVGAVAGSLGVYLVNSMTGATEETKKFNDAIKETVEGLQSVRLEQTIGTINTLTDTIKENEKELSRLSDLTFAKIGGRATSNARRLELQAENQEKINKLEKENKVSQEALLVLEKRRKDIAAEEDDTIAVENKSMALERELELQKELERIQTNLKGVESQLDPNVAVINAAERRLAIIDAANAQDLNNQAKYDALRVANAQKLSDDLVAIEERTQLNKNAILSAGAQATLSMTAGLLGQAAALAREGGEKQFKDYKNLASAQAAISAGLTIANVLAADSKIYGSAAIPLAVATGALAFAQIAQIQGQEYQSSRASGGQAKGRVLVGENGPEVLNLGSQTGYVSPTTSLDKNGGGNNTTVFNVSAGVQGTVRSEILSLMPFFQQMAVQAAAQSAKNGGTMAKAVRLR